MTNHMTPAELASTICETSSPAELAAALAPHWLGTIQNVEISEDLLGWTVRVTVQPNDARRRPIIWAEHGETRGSALQQAIDAVCAWASVHGLEAN